MSSGLKLCVCIYICTTPNNAQEVDYWSVYVIYLCFVTILVMREVAYRVLDIYLCIYDMIILFMLMCILYNALNSLWGGVEVEPVDEY